ncbi:DUF3320 domain-containing protein [Actinomycetospora rhizophila]|uniref:DUF3320 domain-containing protein n=1 Tax=Actinomycetospora rhizophila TaxID=1416876 RepID=A0ABV9Z635_9PSEU
MDQPVSVDVVRLDFVNHAMANSGISPVRRLRLRAAKDLHDVCVEVSVVDGMGELLVTPWARSLEVVRAERPVAFQSVPLLPDPRRMAAVEETHQATLLVRVDAGGQQHTHREPLRVLAHHHWVLDPLEHRLSVELLAAFVLPHHPEIAEVLTAARDHLRTTTGDPSMSGYQRGPEHVDAVAGAIYRAVQDRDVAYGVAPASWEHTGQRVRTPEQVLRTERVGTCLDTTVLLAAAFEQAGLHPLLCVPAGHAFVGYWREEELGLSQVAAHEIGTVTNLVDLGRARFLETTVVTSGPSSQTFDEACATGHRQLRQAGDELLLGVVDVREARRNGVVPLPARHIDDGGSVVITVQAPATPSATTPTEQPPSRPVPHTGQRTDDAPPRVAVWKNALLDLTRRNRLINFTAGPSATRLALPESALGELEDRLHQGRTIKLHAADDLPEVRRAQGVTSAGDLPDDVLTDRLRRQQVFTELDTTSFAGRMRTLQRKARTLREESGSANLYIALGTLQWSAADGKPLRSPLLLLPVVLTLGRRGQPPTLTLDEGGETAPNLCLLEKLRTELGIELPALADPPVDEHGIDLAATLRAVRETLAERDLPFSVRESADLAILHFSSFVLWRDLDDHWERFTAAPLVHHLVHTPTREFTDPVAAPAPSDADLDALASVCPVPADSSQLAAVADARAGRTFVLEGPPGTGKSQTITNLLAHLVAAGKRVLFVAEKRAALDVVRARLDQVGLADLALDLHDKAAKPSTVRTRLLRALDAGAEVDVDGHRVADLDLRTATGRLARYRDLVHGENAIGLSLYSARTAVLAVGEGPTLEVARAFVTGADRDVLADLRHRLRNAPEAVWHARPRRHHPWGFVRGTATVDTAAAAAGVRIADGALAVLAGAPPSVRGVLDAATTARELHVAASVARPGRPPLALLDEVLSPRWEAAASELRRAVDGFVAAQRPALATARPEAVALDLDGLHQQAVTADAAFVIGRKKKQLAVLDRLRPGLRDDAAPDRRTLAPLVDDLRTLRTEIADLRRRAVALPGIALPEDWNPLVEPDRVGAQISALQREARATSLAALPEGPFRDAVRAHLVDPAVNDPRWHDALTRLAGGLGAALDAAGAEQDATDRWRDGAGLVAAWVAEAPARRADVDTGFVALRRWDELRAVLEPLVRHGSAATADAVLDGGVGADEVVAALERGLAAAALEERLETTGLGAFDAVAHERAVAALTASADEVRRHLVDVIPRQVLDSRRIDAETTRGRVGELRRELGRQRGGLSIRRLLARYGDLVTQVTPCVLVGPDSLARFLAPDAVTFDLVVFDEASQIRVADAVGALGRARAAVVVGDSKQMPPTVFGGAGLDDGPGDDPDPTLETVPEDEESVLSECVQARVPQRWLSWHYRSRDESLIAFSNRQYYEGRLASFPAPPRDDTGVSFRRVPGRFHRTATGDGPLRTNPVEARALVDEVVARFARDEEPSIGIVTFNIQQRDLVDEQLRALDDPRITDALERDDGTGLFVKNLENVQGDERDLVLFSVAFAHDARGKLPLNFGPLNRAGGERRLNVAVTRARREIVVFCSFDPADLRAEDTSAVGIHHLRAYLEMAAGGVESSGDAAARPVSARDRHRDELAAALRARGYAVRTDVGLSEFRLDLTVAPRKAPDEPALVVLLDGPGWSRRRTVGDRDGLPANVLEGALGWPHVARVWLPSWLADPTTVLDGLCTRVESVVRGEDPEPPTPREESPESSPGRAVEPSPPRRRHHALGLTRLAPIAAEQPPQSTAPAPDAAAEPGSSVRMPFRPWSVVPRGERQVLDSLPHPRSRELVRHALAEVVAAEGPVEAARLARTVAGAFGLSRVNADRRDAVLACLPTDLLRDAEGFVWPPGTDPRTWTDYRVANGEAERKLEEIPLREIANAMDDVESGTGGMDENELFRDTLALFGFSRMTDGVRGRLASATRHRRPPSTER